MPSNKVVIGTGEPGEALATLERTLELSRFWEILEQAVKASGVGKEAFRILIKPDMEHYDHRSATAADPQLVEHLIGLLYARGYSQVLVGCGPDPAGLWLDNRDLLILADLAGYQYATAAGEPYDIVDLGEGPFDPEAFPEDSILHQEGLSAHWQDSHFRINFAKNKTEEAYYFALGLHNLLGILPLRAREFHYHHRLQAPEVAAELLLHTTVHFTIIDAWLSNHGSQGTRVPHPIETRTFIAGDHLLLADWAAALKMGQDPYASPLNGSLLRREGLPLLYEIEGDLAPYAGWKNVPKIVRESTVRRNEQAVVDQLLKAWLQTVNTDLFPFRNPIDAQLNRWLAPLFADAEKHPLAQWALIGLNYFLANLHNLQHAWQILYDKDRLYRRESSLGIEPEQFSEADFDHIEHYILPLAQVARHTPPDANGLRWRYLDGSVLFAFSKIIPVAYSTFVEKVDITQAVQLMYDNIGGARQAIRKDQQERVIHQAERDIYLPQPNWIVLFGGDYIDVGKLEKIRYSDTSREIFWKTVNSANHSATFDDGMISFREDPGGTLVTIVARQKFSLPLFWQVLDIDYLPDLKKALVSDSYLRFLSRTMANYEALCEGRDPRIGRAWPKDYGQKGTEDHPLAVESLKDAWGVLSGFFSSISQQSGQPQAVGTDEHGYQHYEGGSSGSAQTDRYRQFVYDLGRAMQKDIQVLINLPNKKDRL